MKKELRVDKNQNITSARDCSGNPASHHIFLLLYLYSLYLQWCDADCSEKPVPTPLEVGEAPKQMSPRNPLYSNQRFSLSAQRFGSEATTYTYDHSGNRIKKHLQNANTTTYSFGDLYEIHRAPGEPEKHTMYITGMQGDKVSQYSRPDAMLVMNAEGLALNAEPAPFGSQSGAGFGFAGVLVNAFWNTPKSVYLEMERDLAMVYHGLPSIALFKDSGVPKPIAKIFFWLFCLTLLLYYAVKLKSENPRIIRITSAIATYAFFFASGYGCTPLFYGGAQTEEGIPPWLLGLAIPGNTPSVSDAPGNYGGGGGAVGGGQSTARIPGMFFYHPDHLGSITMITDGHGQVLAGGERGGKSHISYRPYGEIFRTDSYGPDISKYKYTGQEEDRESGLYYYKARYYDPVIGRFAQADSMIFPNKVSGMNRFMYVSGNPMIFNDPTGNIDVGHMVSQFIKHMAGGAKAAAKGIKGVSDRITKGKRSRRGGNDFEKGMRKYKEAGTFMKRFYTDIKFTVGVMEGVLDFTLATLNGNKPYITYHHGGFVVNNSYLAGNPIGALGSQGAYVRGGVGHVSKGTSKGVKKHEYGHIRQDLHGGFYANQPGILEWANDLTELTMNYDFTPFLMNDLFGREAYEVIRQVNYFYDPQKTFYLDALYELSEQYPFLRTYAMIKPFL